MTDLAIGTLEIWILVDGDGEPIRCIGEHAYLCHFSEIGAKEAASHQKRLTGHDCTPFRVYPENTEGSNP